MLNFDESMKLNSNKINSIYVADPLWYYKHICNWYNIQVTAHKLSKIVY